MNKEIMIRFTLYFLRLSLAVAFLSAVADRFGFWGSPGDPNVAWGEWSVFVDYVAVLNPLIPKQLIPPLAWITTLLEIGAGIGLIIGWKIRWMALGSAVLLLFFGLAMSLSTGIKSPLDYSVFTAAAASFSLWIISKPGLNTKDK
jgi:uncharacterized membrane protein YphA (DoxX/SURF4 family)